MTGVGYRLSPIGYQLVWWLAVGCVDAGAKGPADTVVVAGALDTSRATIAPTARDLVVRAREHDRADRRDSARALYEQAAREVPEIADWLHLRAAGVVSDSAERRRIYSRIDSEVARDRIPWTEAFARERTGDIEGAIRAYAAVGAPLSALRLRLARAGTDDAARDRIRADLLEVIRAHRDREIARDAIVMFDQTFQKASAAEQLSIARRAASVNSNARAAAGFAAAFRAGLGNASDRFTYGTVLARLNRDRDAAAQFARVNTAAAQYQRARAEIAFGNVAAARATLRSIVTRWSSDTSAASALLLLADLAGDENREEAARTALLDAARRFPGSRHAPAAMFRAAMIAYVHGRHRAAADEFAQLAQRYPRADDATAARYWAGRAYATAGERERADSLWRDVMTREPGSYYAVLAAARLRTNLTVAPGDTGSRSSVPAVDDAMRRVALLRALDMNVEARHEYDRLFRDAERSPDRLLATAEAFSGTDQASRAVTLGWRLVEQVGRNARTYRVVYPVVERERIASESRANGLDPVLVASLIRQESNFNPRATSPVGARGLMQIMPDVGRMLARRKGIANFAPDSLYNPAINITLGTMHLRNLLGDSPNVVRALAAYNAGESRVRRWATKAGAADPEVFTERIPFVETRGYVRAIVRNRAFYQALYSW